MAREQGASKLAWIDVLKGAAFWWIALNHVVERTMGAPYAANPTGDWPPIGERVAQLRPLRRGALSLPLNAVRYAGWAGDRAVGIFLILSGFGLAYGAKTETLDVRAFYRRRAMRVYPQWLAAHAAFAAARLVTGTGASPREWRFYASAAGLRALPATMYWFAPAWWYVGAQMQLYALYPLLDRIARRFGEPALAAASTAIGVNALAAVGPRLRAYRDPWYRGAIAVTRLPEFTLGIALGAAYRSDPEGTDARLGSPAAVALAAAASLLGDALSVTLRGMAVVPALASASSLVLGYTLCRGDARTPVRRFLAWSGRHSYGLFLVHHPFVEIFVPAAGAPRRTAVGIALAAAATLTCGPALEAAAGAAVEGPGRALRMLGIGAVCAAAVLAAAEAAVRAWDPQEVLGWGERPALEPHERFGWRLRPGRRTRLRWESYDYVVDANDHGFPGAYPPEARVPGSLRILTLGDAFTSAEGVDTADAWPRLLERELAADGRPVDVVNFGITGYGPEQYAAVAAEFVPRLRPDIVLIGMSVVDFQDALMSNEAFRASIGFRRPPAGGLSGRLRLLHLRRWIEIRVKEPAAERLRGTPSTRGLFLGNVAGLDRANAEMHVAAERTREWYGTIRDAAEAAGGRLVVALVPAPVQVCGPRDLDYYPRGIDLTDTERFDLDRPQRLTAEICRDLGVAFVDLRAALRIDAGGSPYQRGNMHFTHLGHRQVAAHLAQWLRDRLTAAEPR